MIHHHVSPLRARLLAALATTCVVASTLFAPAAAADDGPGSLSGPEPSEALAADPPAEDPASTPPAAVGITAAPANTAVPAISGTLEVGQTLSATNGTWNNAPTSYTYQWQRCNSPAAPSCSDIAGATSSNYTLVGGDATRRIRVRVTAVNVDGSTTANSGVSAAVSAGIIPAKVTDPVISGTTTVGQTLSVSNGTWTGTEPMTFTYQWRRCNSNTGPGGCSDIAGATAAFYALAAADATKYMRVRVTATNQAGDRNADSAFSAQVAAAIAPSNTVPPAISGTAEVGETLTVNPGTWSGTAPITYTYQWLRCSSTSVMSCSTISGATGESYVLGVDDGGYSMRVRVTATNVAGSVTETSAATSEVPNVGPPTMTLAPTVTGIAEVGETLTAEPGTWSSTTPVTYAYQWLRCDSADHATCSDITGADSETYELAHDDYGKHVAVRVLADSGYGSAAAVSPLTGVVTATSPTLTGTAPDMVGVLQSGHTLTVDLAGVTFAGTAPISISVLWARCTGGTTSSCDWAGATAQGVAYTLTDADVGSWIAVRVRAENLVGSRTLIDGPSGPVLANASINATPVTDGRKVTVSGSGYLPGSTITFTLFAGSPPVLPVGISSQPALQLGVSATGTLLGTTVAGSGGTYSVTFTLPASLAGGPYYIQAAGTGVDTSALRLNTAITLAELPVTPVTPVEPVAPVVPSVPVTPGPVADPSGPVSAGPRAADLAHTGTNADSLAALGAALFASGLVLLGARRRRVPLLVR